MFAPWQGVEDRHSLRHETQSLVEEVSEFEDGMHVWFWQIAFWLDCGSIGPIQLLQGFSLSEELREHFEVQVVGEDRVI